MDVSQYLDVYIEEAREHVQTLNEGLLALESGSADSALVNELFRAAHTIKGMAGTMGFRQTQELTHALETILDEVRSGKKQPAAADFKVMFAAVDIIDALVNSVSPAGEPEAKGFAEAISALTGRQGKSADLPREVERTGVTATGDELSEHAQAVAQAALTKGWFLYRVRVQLSPDCLLKSARAYLVFNRLTGRGEVIQSVPSVPDIEQEKFGSDFTLWVISPEPGADLQQLLLDISEVVDVRIDQIFGEASASVAAAAEPAAAKGQTAAQMPTSHSVHTVRVDISRLDHLMNLMSELLISRTRLNLLGREIGDQELGAAASRLGRIVLDLQDEVMHLRMVPVEQVFNRFPRMMRDLSTQLNKKIKFEMSGEKTELDRTIVDEIGDPLVHLLRNAVDHGLESTAERLNRGKAPEGTVKLSARQQGDAVIIEVSDDGKGIDWARVQRKAENKGWIESGADVKQDRLADLLFRPGFSTADQVTELSGRGVGLDVVRSKITALGGRVTLVSTPGVGTTFTVTLPLTLAVMEALLVKVKGETYALPLASVIQTTLRTRSDFNRVQGQVVTDYLGEVLPVQSLCSLIDPDQGTEIGDECLVVVMNDGNRHIGIGVDSLIGQEEIVVKAMGRFTGHGPGVTGATILGDGRLALILEVTALLQEGV